MKNFLMLLFVLFTVALNAQSSIYDGTYLVKYQADNGDFHEYKITLNPDNTFSFHHSSKISMGIPPEKNGYGKGTWRAEKNVLFFTTDKIKDFDETHTLDFSNTKARYYTKSPRNKSDSIIPTKLIFYESDIFWMNRKELLKL